MLLTFNYSALDWDICESCKINLVYPQRNVTEKWQRLIYWYVKINTNSFNQDGWASLEPGQTVGCCTRAANQQGWCFACLTL